MGWWRTSPIKWQGKSTDKNFTKNKNHISCISTHNFITNSSGYWAICQRCRSRVSLCSSWAQFPCTLQPFEVTRMIDAWFLPHILVQSFLNLMSDIAWLHNRKKVLISVTKGSSNEDSSSYVFPITFPLSGKILVFNIVQDIFYFLFPWGIYQILMIRHIIVCDSGRVSVSTLLFACENI